MDHDPRNPAYIATQGPLPHTVADFWQVSIALFSTPHRVVNMRSVIFHATTKLHWPYNIQTVDGTVIVVSVVHDSDW